MRYTWKFKSKKVLYWLFYSIWLISIVICIDYIFYYCYTRKLSHIDRPKNIEYPIVANTDPITIRRVSQVTPDKKSSYVNFKCNKKYGTIRIGCFGDSFTHGDEVSDIYDYPSILQDIFTSKGFLNIEVINFGNAWHGFHQAYMLWEDVGRKYDLDYVLLGPLTFLPLRDTVFNHTYGCSPYFIHSRYIIKGNKVELVDIFGNNYAETFKNYYSFIPKLALIKYDRQTPVFLRCLIPEGRELKNPFYYFKGSRQEEAYASYRILVARMAEKLPVILGSYNNKVVDMGKGIKDKNLYSVKLLSLKQFPYLSSEGHNSPAGNQILAQQYFDSLTNGQESKMVILHTEDLSTSVVTPCLEGSALSIYDDVSIELQGTKLGCFWKQIESVSLLGLKDSSISALDAVFIPLDFKIKKGMKLLLEIEGVPKNKTYDLGEVTPVYPGLNIGIVNIEGSLAHDWLDILYINLERCPIIGENKFNQNTKIHLFLDNNLIMEGTIESNLKIIQLLPMNYRFQRLRSRGDINLDMNHLQDNGIVYLLAKRGECTTKVPFARWTKKTIVVPLRDIPPTKNIKP